MPTIGMQQKIEILKEMEADIIATQLLEEAGVWLYEECTKSKVISLPHALNPNQFKKTHVLEDRNIDIGIMCHFIQPFLILRLIAIII